jgi:AraC-like DNA-binding protein
LPFYKVYQPTASLTGLVREIQVYHANWNEEPGLPAPYITCLANTEQNLYFYLNDPIKIVIGEGMEIPVPPAVVTGRKYKPVGLLFGKDHLMIKVAFQPTGTWRLLNINMGNIINKGLDATAFWGEALIKLIQKLKRQSSYDSMVDLVEKFLEEQQKLSCRKQEVIDEVATEMLNPLTDYTLEQWSKKACLSIRQFQRNFITRVGVSPKLFIRIVRFEGAMKIKNEYPAKSWAEIALECGYTDSSHILREFKEFADFPPCRFYMAPTSGYSEFQTG